MLCVPVLDWNAGSKRLGWSCCVCCVFAYTVCGGRAAASALVYEVECTVCASRMGVCFPNAGSTEHSRGNDPCTDTNTHGYDHETNTHTGTHTHVNTHVNDERTGSTHTHTHTSTRIPHPSANRTRTNTRNPRVTHAHLSCVYGIPME